ncbi:sensory rhodopsin transducer [Pontibacter korlensis]|uniref:Sensory rhodopsin transducer n=2 Tax=Pontibacter korlensis TaxID=400092 RepID=A0A0E3ZHA8_9BACT|nr:hypothetical protein PKOR_22740 [Pontibacter korlensis]
MYTLGKKSWLVLGGHMPRLSTGFEPAFTSSDQLAILNTSPEDAELALTIYFTKGEPVGPFEFRVKARRIRKVRFNDLIDPQALPLAQDYACHIQSSQLVVVQFSRLNSGQRELALLGTMAFPADRQER